MRAFLIPALLAVIVVMFVPDMNRKAAQSNNDEISRLADELVMLSSSLDQSSDQGQMSEIVAKLGELQEFLVTSGEELRGRVKSLEDRVAKLENRPADGFAQSGQLDSRFAEIQKEIASLRDELKRVAAESESEEPDGPVIPVIPDEPEDPDVVYAPEPLESDPPIGFVDPSPKYEPEDDPPVADGMSDCPEGCDPSCECGCQGAVSGGYSSAPPVVRRGIFGWRVIPQRGKPFELNGSCRIVNGVIVCD